jgi:hypothetical protein
LKWLEEFGKGLLNLGNILIGIVAVRAFFDEGFNIASLITIMGGIGTYIIGILAIKRSENGS